MALTSSDTPEEQLQKQSISPGEGCYNLHPATVTYRSYCPTATVFSGVLNCLLSGNPLLQAPSLQGEILINQITGNLYTYDYANRLFKSNGEIDNDMEDLHRFMRNHNKSELDIYYSSTLDIQNYWMLFL